MTELKLKFKDEKGEIKEIPVSTEEFFIGRHTENDLGIADSAVSRKHLKIQRYADVFVASDLDSTLGTKINGEKMNEPVALKNGDKFVLGDNIEIDVLLEDENAFASDETGDEILKEEIPEANLSDGQSAAPANPGGGNSVPISFFFIAPVLGVVILLLVGGVFLVIKSGEKKEIAEGNDFIYTSNRLQENNRTEDFDNSNPENNSTNISVPTNENTNIDTGNISTNEII
jgi:pSer/pThr/pTyr-binding forkhead associated (FHA) protein